MMRLNLLLSICFTFAPPLSGAQRNLTIPAAGNALLPCGSFTGTSVMVTWRMEDLNDTWTSLEIKSGVGDLDLDSPTVLVIRNRSLVKDGDYSCWTDNSDTNVTVIEVEGLYFYCEAPENWTRLSWSRDKEVIVAAERGGGARRMYITVVGNETSLSIPSVTPHDAGIYHCAVSGQQSSVRLYVTQTSGIETFLSDGYWIIVLAALGYIGFCGAAMSVYMCIRRKRRRRKSPKARFYKVSSAARNLYTDSLNQAQGTDPKPEDFMYQNFNEISMKESNKDCNSAASSFMDHSADGDSYLEPNDIGDHDMSEDEDQYENANEEMKDPSIGSQSYEDMVGSIYIKTGNPQIQDENEVQEDDADSYENMQAPVYSQANHSSASLNKTEEKKTAPAHEDAKITDKLAAILASWNRVQADHELNQDNGDFYISPENHKL